jgi:anti-anti-sigma regulatory factor
MNSNLFERKNFLDTNWMTTNISDYFSLESINETMIIKVNLLRATANEADSMSKYLSKIQPQNNHPFIIDLSKCNFIDSTFLSGIISFNKKTETQIKLVITDTRQLAIFRITKLDSLFRIYSSLESALVA